MIRDPGNANLPIGVGRPANREIGVPRIYPQIPRLFLCALCVKAFSSR
jgi:hypothetical protein